MNKLLWLFMLIYVSQALCLHEPRKLLSRLNDVLQIMMHEHEKFQNTKLHTLQSDKQFIEASSYNLQLIQDILKKLNQQCQDNETKPMLEQVKQKHRVCQSIAIASTDLAIKKTVEALSAIQHQHRPQIG